MRADLAGAFVVFGARTLSAESFEIETQLVHVNQTTVFPALTDGASDADGVITFADTWHVGRSFPGAFPWIEANCPCPKAPCGLVNPTPDVECSEHHGIKTIRQAHPASACQYPRRWGRRR